jgi:hypothetical protein
MPVPGFADNRRPGSIVSRFRARRLALLQERMAPHRQARILDVGGSEQGWRTSGFHERVTILNLQRSREDTGLCRFVQADALRMPFRDKSFGLVVSNSVIEHVGDLEAQTRFACEVRRVALHYWVQAPNRHFPIEPHFLFPGFQFLPLTLKLLVGRHWPFSWPKQYGESAHELDREIRTIRLPSERELRRLFPDGVIYRERLLGMTKSFVIHSPL